MRRSAHMGLDEACGLAAAIDLSVVEKSIVPLTKINPGLFFGSGKVNEIRECVHNSKIDVAIVDAALSPIQQRNLERAWHTKVIDRTGLILEIFGDRAATKEGRLQVELAHLTYQRSRLVRSWTHLERQRGGVGFLGGPGETQIETDRRIISDKISKLKRELEKVVANRELQRRARKKVPYPIVALVGYTNAGKSTLFNLLTHESALAADQLFATLDPKMRRMKLPKGREIILSDTVGFISELPTELVAAFRATLEEVIEADILLHVRDVSSEDTEAQKQDVLSVLTDLGIDADAPERPVVEVLNKIDLLVIEDRERLENEVVRCATDIGPILVSATQDKGTQKLLSHIEQLLARLTSTVELSVDAGQGALIAWIHRHAEVLERHDCEEGTVRLLARFSDDNYDRFLNKPEAKACLVSQRDTRLAELQFDEKK